jgi:hypothetical protein
MRKKIRGIRKTALEFLKTILEKLFLIKTDFFTIKIAKSHIFIKFSSSETIKIVFFADDLPLETCFGEFSDDFKIKNFLTLDHHFYGKNQFLSKKVFMKACPFIDRRLY